jgi:DNA repair protein RecN (Recombination protein N)
MLKSLIVKNYALIDELEINLNSGFSIITGETGAGKSIILGALSLLMGQRAEISVIKDNEQKCVIEGLFEIENYKLHDFFSQNEIDYSSQTIIRREIAQNGKSRAFVNDTPVNLNVLKDLCESLIDIHSQHETLKLNRSDFQLEMIDAYAKNQLTLDKYKADFKELKKLEKNLTELKQIAEKTKTEQDYFQHQFDELFNAKLDDINLQELEKEQEALNNVEIIKQNLAKIYNSINGEEFPAIMQIKCALDASKIIANYLEKTNELSQRLQSVYIEIEDIGSEAEILNNTIEHNQERLQIVNENLDKIYGLLKKHKVQNINELIEIRNNLNAKLNEINSYDENIEKLQKELNIAIQNLKNLAKELSDRRKKIIPNVENEIISLVNQLGMLNATFKIETVHLQDFSATGTDEILFLFSANKNVEPQQIAKVASGGELSRLMLSIKYVVSKVKALPTIIFDEIDTGVSGEIAFKMGNILKQMSKNLQVINITHLPQIAAKGDYHFKVYKVENETRTASEIKQLTDSERLEEIAKMLSGENLSEAAIANAKVLLAN